jgi:hypothetical protein
MDPQVTWQRLLNAYSARNWPDAQEAAEYLLSWLEKGGFPPQILRDAPMDDAWNRSVARAVCRFVMLERDSTPT